MKISLGVLGLLDSNNTSYGLYQNTSLSWTISSFYFFLLMTIGSGVSGMIHTGIWKSMELAQNCTECVNSVVRAWWCKLVKQPWFQLICYTAYLLCSYNFREVSKVWNGDKCWFGILLLNIRDWVQ